MTLRRTRKIRLSRPTLRGLLRTALATRQELFLLETLLRNL
jgi:hypothetical protein